MNEYRMDWLVQSGVLTLLRVIFWGNGETSFEKLEKDLVNHQNHNVDSLELLWVWEKENQNLEIKNAEEHYVAWVKVHWHNM